MWVYPGRGRQFFIFSLYKQPVANYRQREPRVKSADRPGAAPAAGKGTGSEGFHAGTDIQFLGPGLQRGRTIARQLLECGADYGRRQPGDGRIARREEGVVRQREYDNHQ